MSDVKKVLDLIKEEKIEYVDLRFTDPKGKMYHLSMCADIVDEDMFEEGVMFDGSSVPGWKTINDSNKTICFFILIYSPLVMVTLTCLILFLSINSILNE